MDVIIANALSGYFNILDRININLIKLAGLNIFDDLPVMESTLLDVIQDIPRIIPYKRKDRDSDIITISKNDGLMVFKTDMPNIASEYKTIIKNHNDLLCNIKNVRNKYEHTVHIVENKGSIQECNGQAAFFFKIKDIIVPISLDGLINLVKDLNIIFDRIQKDVEAFAVLEDKTHYAYYRWLNSFKFEEYNRLYDSDLLKIVGRIIRV